MKTPNNFFVRKISPGIIIYLFKNQKETTTVSKLSRITEFCICAVYKNIKKLEELEIIEYPVNTTNKTEKQFRLTQKGEEIAGYLINIK